MFKLLAYRLKTGILKGLSPVMIFIGGSLEGQEVQIFWENEYQTIVANGINFEGYNKTGGSEVLASKFVDMMNIMPSQMVRIGMPLKEWEPLNDNNDPSVADLSSFRDTLGTRNSFLRLQHFSAEGKTIWLSLWDVANWMVSNPSANHARKIADFNELCESMLTYLLHAKRNYGVDVDFVSVNEPSIATENGWGGYQIALTAEEQKKLIEKTGKLFADSGLVTRWILALHKVYPSEREYARSILSDTAVFKYIDGVDFHGYWFQQEHDNDLRQWGELIAEYSLPSFVGECDYDNQFWLNPEYNTWNEPSDETGLLHYKLINMARVSGVFPWYPYARPYRHVHQHYMNALLPGTKIVEVISEDPEVLVTAGRNVDDDVLSIVIQNLSLIPKTVTIHNLPDIQYTHIQSVSDRYYIEQEPITAERKKLTFTLPANSLHTLTGTGGSLPIPLMSGDRLYGSPPLRVNFDGSSSFDPVQDTITTFIWDFGDGIKDSTTGPLISHDYLEKGVYYPTLTVVGNRGYRNYAYQRLFVTDFDTIFSTRTAPIIDGQRDEIWESGTPGRLSSFITETIPDTTVYNINFCLLYTRSFLYLLCEVKDLDFVQNREDCVQFFFDPGNEKSDTCDADDFSVRIYPGHLIEFVGEIDTTEIRSAIDVTADGYIAEIAIPRESIKFKLQDNDLIGFDVFARKRINENDTYLLAWNATACEFLTNPSMWGLMQMAENPSSPPNNRPNTSIIRPYHSSSSQTDEDIRFTVFSTDPDPEDIKRVELYLNDTLTAYDHSGATTFYGNLTNVPAGNHTVYSIVYDRHNEYNFSDVVCFSVLENTLIEGFRERKEDVWIFPNPFSSDVTFRIHIPVASQVTVSLYDDSGKAINILFNGQMQPGKSEIEKDLGQMLAGLTPGIYFVHIHISSSLQEESYINRLIKL